ncbi:MAG: ABC transporter ATP-binding protein, partial [Clostridiales bacterium]|nr:ABC transporter ATP-binding protein [Clostridiales bacterium]
MNSGNILEAKELCKSFPGFSLKKVSFSVPSGFIMGFVGPNGAGKTTTLKLLLKISKPDSGSVLMFGRESAMEDNGKIGIAMDSPFYSDDWTALDIEKAISRYYKSWDKGKYSEYLKKFGLAPDKKVRELSRGMKVKLQLAVALCHDAKLLVLDEPTSGLDPVARDEICDLLREFITDSSKSVLFSTHITADLEKVADYITFILDGSIVYTGPKDDLLEKYARVAGGLGELSLAQKKLVIGLREHATGFEGMAECRNIPNLPKSVLTE